MAEENRDQMLAFFQACTGIEDVAVALSRLESTNWNLMRAVDEAIPENATNRTNTSSPDIEMIQEIRPKKFITHDIDDSGDDDSILVVDNGSTSDGQNNWQVLSKPSTSNNHTSQIRIKLAFENQTSTSLDVPSNWTVLNLKKEIHQRTKIPVCRQAITGWPGNSPRDVDKLSELHSTDLSLHVRDMKSDGTTADDLLKTYLLKIKNLTNNETLELPYLGAKSIRELKCDVYNLSEIPARLQDWSGWPVPITNDEVCLGQLGLNYPEHHLTLNAREPPSVQDSKKSKRNVQTDDSDDSSIGDYEDPPESFGGEDLFAPARGIVKPLMPPKTEDEAVGCLQFAEEFVNRYGPVHPEFFPGTLDNAIKEACMKPARERRLLALYLHHDRSVCANVFCTQILCRESVIQILATYFILWGWDLTCPFNKYKFFDSFEKELGSIAAMQIKDLPDERLPAIIIINRVRAGLEIMSVIQGNVMINDLLASLTETIDVFLEQQKVEASEEDKRSVREMIKMQQDAAFRESLEMDRAKEEARRNQEVAVIQEQQREREQREEAAALKEAERLSVESRLPVEPAENTGAISKIRVRLPKGQFLERRFNETDKLQTLLDWLHVKGFRSSEYKFLSSWPRKDLTAADPNMSLKDHSLCPQDTVIIEER